MTSTVAPLARAVRRTLLVVALNATMLGLASSCTQAKTPEPPPPTPTPSLATTASVASPTQAPPSVTPELQNKQNAEAAVVRFWRVIDDLSTNREAKLEQLTTVSRGSAAAQWRQNIRDYRYEQVKQTGKVQVSALSAAMASRNSQYDVTACVDVGDVNLVDREGKSVVSAGRPPRVRYRYVVQEDAKKWYVVKEKAIGTC